MSVVVLVVTDHAINELGRTSRPPGLQIVRVVGQEEQVQDIPCGPLLELVWRREQV